MRLLPVVVLVALLSSSCTSAESEPESTPQSVEATEALDKADETGSKLGVDDPPPSPLARFLLGAGLIERNSWTEPSGTFELRQAAFDQVRLCMAEEGFEWAPPGDTYFTGSAAREGSPEWFESYGFGVSTQAFTTKQVGPDLLGTEGDREGTDVDEFNAEYLAGLTPEELDAYYNALHGQVVGDPDPAGGTSPDCLDRYWYEYVRSDTERTQGFQEFFAKELEGISERVNADDRLISLENEVADCVRNEGFDEYTDIEAAIWELHDGIDDLLARVDEGESSPDLTDAEFDALSESEFEALFNAEPPELTSSERAELTGIQDYELSLASAWKECGGTPRIDNLRQTLFAEYETQFLIDNEGQVLAYIETIIGTS